MTATDDRRGSAAPDAAAPLAIICGGGSLPFAVADAAQRQGRPVVLFALQGSADPQRVTAYTHHWMRYGEAKRFMRLMTDHGARDVVWIGTVTRPNFTQLRLDWHALSLLPRLIKLFRGGDDHLLSGLAKLFEEHGYRLIGAHEIAPEILMPQGRIGTRDPSDNDRSDIAMGLALLRATGPFDIGQAVVVAEGRVLAIEAAEGTDEMLARLADLHGKGRVRFRPGTGVLVKAPKPRQDRRVDLPSIGPRTVEGAARAGLAGIAVVAGSAIVAEPERLAQASDRHRLFVVGIAHDGVRLMAEGDTRSVGPPATMPTIFMVAVEESGDRLGAALMRALRERTGGAVAFAGVGGRGMAAEGLQSLHPIEGFSIIGFSSIPERLPRLMRHLRETLQSLRRVRPAALVVIDSPGYNLWLARFAHRADPNLPIFDYVSPSVWAWRPGRARAMRRFVSHVLALLPFEPEAHRRLGGPPCSYVGHPVVDEIAMLRPNALEARRRLADPPVMLVLPGSRRGEIERLAGVFGDAIGRLRDQTGPLAVVVPTVPELRSQVEAATKSWPVMPRIVVDAADKYAAFRIARAALAKSGTVTLELALAGVPMVAAYRLSAFDYAMAGLLVSGTTVILANLVLGENVVPEFLQHDCTAANLSAALLPLMTDTAPRRRQIEAFARLDRIMELGSQAPAQRAADIVLAGLRSQALPFAGQVPTL